jgi:hypothetical protein
VPRAERPTRARTTSAKARPWWASVIGSRSTWLGVAWLACGQSSASATEFRGGGRLQSSFVHDGNIVEATVDSNRTADSFLRILGEVRLRAGRLPLDSRAELMLRGFSESYLDHPAVDRRQGEVDLPWCIASDVTRRRFEIEAGRGARAYPDSSGRGHHRNWGRAPGAVPAGPHGSLVARFETWQLDFLGTPQIDRAGTGFDLAYEHRLSPRNTLRTGLELGSVRCGWLSQSLVVHGDGQDPPVTSVEGRSHRRDQYRFLHAGWRRIGRLVLQLQVGYRVQASNSFDGAFRRPEATWLVSRPLAGRVIGQFYGNLEHTTYDERRIGGVVAVFPGKINAGEDDNTVALRLARPIGKGWDLDARVGWYRNESVDIGVYYRKRVVSIGVTRNFGEASGF